MASPQAMPVIDAGLPPFSMLTPLTGRGDAGGVVGVPGAVVAAGWCVGATADADGDAPQLASKNTLISTTKLTIIFFMTDVSFFFREVFIFYKFYVVEHLF